MVEIKGDRGLDAQEKAPTMKTYWVPGVNHLGSHGRWPLAEFCDNDETESDFKAKVESQFSKMITAVAVLNRRSQYFFSRTLWTRFPTSIHQRASSRSQARD